MSTKEAIAADGFIRQARAADWQKIGSGPMGRKLVIERHYRPFPEEELGAGLSRICDRLIDPKVVAKLTDVDPVDTIASECA
ncbi:MAG: hypothetical protein PVI59_01790, partial [Anaerolineae bacterium]